MVWLSDINKLRLKSRLWKNPIWKFLYIYVSTVFMTIHAVFKYKFDFDKIHVHLNMIKKDAKYELDKAKERNIQLNHKLKELKKKRNAEI